jgi:histidine triad (HIT) family protein
VGVDAEHRGLVSAAVRACVFCDIVAGRAPAAIVLDTAAVVAFADLRQAVPGHVLVVPRRHVETLYELEPGDGAALMAAAVRVARAVRDAFMPEGLSLWQSNGAAAFQEVPHVHLHVQPRWLDDGLLRVYSDAPTDAPRARIDEIAARIRAHLPTADPQGAGCLGRSGTP